LIYKLYFSLKKNKTFPFLEITLLQFSHSVYPVCIQNPDFKMAVVNEAN